MDNCIDNLIYKDYPFRAVSVFLTEIFHEYFNADDSEHEYEYSYVTYKLAGTQCSFMVT